MFDWYDILLLEQALSPGLTVLWLQRDLLLRVTTAFFKLVAVIILSVTFNCYDKEQFLASNTGEGVELKFLLLMCLLPVWAWL